MKNVFLTTFAKKMETSSHAEVFSLMKDSMQMENRLSYPVQILNNVALKERMFMIKIV
mgnify:CR=1 FL=1